MKKHTPTRKLSLNALNVIFLEPVKKQWNECGICEYKAETFDGLEIHLVTCEIFKCRYCDFNEKNLSEFKKHTAKEHNPGQFHTILHYKMDRTNQNEVCCNTLGWDKI